MNETSDTVESLTKEYQKWCAEHGYPQMSADELLAETDDAGLQLVRSDHRTYLYEFIRRWEEAQK